MELVAFQQAVAAAESSFRATTPTSPEELFGWEASVGFPLPASARWLLANYGCSANCGLDSLSESAQATLRCRQTIGLPPEIVILNDWGDAGVVYLDFRSSAASAEPPVVWAGTHNLYRLAAGEAQDSDLEVFTGFAEWTLSQAEERANEL